MATLRITCGNFKTALPMKTLRIFALIATLAVTAIAAEGVGFTANDTTSTVLQRQMGQRVELRLKSGDKLVGKIESVGVSAVHISALAGQELFDAVVNLGDISAVIVRAAK